MSRLSRRLSEFLGVALFALALLWLIALASYDPTDPVWFFTTETGQHPANFAGRVGSFLAELSFQLFGYAAYLVPLLVGVAAWHYFWCQPAEAAYTKLAGVTLLFVCTGALLGLAFGSVAVASGTFHAGGVVGVWTGGLLAEYLNRTGAVIVLLTLILLAVLLSTQVSFGGVFAGTGSRWRDVAARTLGRARGWIDDRRKERARREAIARNM